MINFAAGCYDKLFPKTCCMGKGVPRVMITSFQDPLQVL